MKRVVFGLLGIHKDAGSGAARWERWRPTVSVVSHPDLLVDRFELLHTGATSLLDRVCADLRSVSPETEVVPRQITMDAPWDFESVYATLHAFARDYPFAPDDEDYLVHITTGTHVAQICLYLLTESRHLPARLLQTAPPRPRSRGRSSDDDHPSAGEFTIIDLDLSRYDQIAARFAAEQADAVTVLKGGVSTRNAGFNRQIELIERVAVASPEPILLLGPTGAGKSRLARRIYDLRARRGHVTGPLVDVNCATLRGDTAMSTLFGHRRGAFTGAAADREGLLRAADGGLLFLDEVGDLGLDEQAMLLRALEEKRFMPMGGDREITSDFQLICGTNRDLRADVAAGRFRDDLLARVDLWTFHLPGLRDRLEDLAPNLDHELDLFAERHGRRVRFNREARDRYLAFATSADAAWSGNFRDLNASVTRMATLAASGRITVPIVDDEITRLRRAWRPAPLVDDPLDDVLGEDAAAKLDLFDQAQLREVLRVCRRSASLSDAGRTLFAVSRARRRSVNDADRLRKYLARFGLEFGEITTPRSRP